MLMYDGVLAGRAGVSENGIVPSSYIVERCVQRGREGTKVLTAV